MSKAAGEEIAMAGSTFLRSVTGNSFGVHNRPADLERAGTVLRSGAEFIVRVRQSRMADLDGWRQRS